MPIRLLFILWGLSYSLLWVKLTYLQIFFRLSSAQRHRTARPHHASTLLCHLSDGINLWWSLFLWLGRASLAKIQWWPTIIQIQISLLRRRSTAVDTTANKWSRILIFHLWLEMSVFRLSYFSACLRTNIFVRSTHFCWIYYSQIVWVCTWFLFL